MIEVSRVPHLTNNLGGPSTLWILGFSARALAKACRDAGFSVIALDHFLDHDLNELTQGSFRLRQWPNILDGCHWLNKLPTRAPLLLSGGTESAEVRQQLNCLGAVCGPTSEQLSKLRDFKFWSAAAEACGFRFPSTQELRVVPRGLDEQGFPPDGVVSARERPKKIRKRLNSSGGLGISPVDLQNEGVVKGQSNEVQQAFIEGRSLGVSCILANHGSHFAGMTSSFGSGEWPGPLEFIYRGSWGPLPVSEGLSQKFEKIGDYVNRHTGLLGWLQMDFIEDTDSELWLLEMNPRWAAGMEVLLDAGINLVPAHLNAFYGDRYSKALVNSRDGQAVPSGKIVSSAPRQYFAKAIVYADNDLELSYTDLNRLYTYSRKRIADLPAIDGEDHSLQILAGHPVLTLKASAEGSEPEEARQTLLVKLGEIQESLSWLLEK